MKRQLLVYHFTSNRLKACGYDITTAFDEARELREIVTLADNQFLRTIRAVRNRTINPTRLERLFAEKKRLWKMLQRKPHETAALERLHVLEGRINRTLFVPDYVEVTFDHPAHYEHVHGRWVGRSAVSPQYRGANWFDASGVAQERADHNVQVYQWRFRHLQLSS